MKIERNIASRRSIFKRAAPQSTLGGWTKNIPRHPGMYEMVSMEGQAECDDVRVFRKPFEGLWAEHRDLGTMPIQHLHDGLTDVKWRPKP